MIDKNLIKNEIINNLTPKEILESHGFILNKYKNGYTTQALHKGDSNKSLHINKIGNVWLWHDWTGIGVKASNSGGNSYNLLWEFNDTLEDVINEYEKITGREIKKSLSSGTEDSEDVMNLAKLLSKYNDNIFLAKNKDILDYLISRGYTETYIRDRQIGYNEFTNKHGVKHQQIVFPYYNELGQIRSYVIRNLVNLENKYVPKYKKGTYLVNENDLKLLPYNIDTALFKKEIVLTEGIVDSDMIVMHKKSGSIAVGGNGTSEEAWNKYIIPTLEKKQITLIMDNDQAGLNIYKKNIKRLLDNNIFDFKVAVVPKNEHLNNIGNLIELYESHFNENIKSEIKDINDYFIKYKDLNGIFKTSIDGIFYYALDCERNKNMVEFEQFLINKSRFMNPTNILIVLNDLLEAQVINNDLYKHFLKLVKNPPSQSFITNEILNKHMILYNEGLGFYEFKNKTWEYISEHTLHDYINNSLGERFIDGRLYLPINKVIKSKTITYDTDFNKCEKMAFQNGTLNIKTGGFINDFNPNDRLTNITSYNYDPLADCPKWKNFLYEVCEVRNNEKETENKIKVLQEFAGYILFPNCKLEKALLLTGEGSNGKSVFIKILTEVFNDCKTGKAVSHVDVSDLGKDFHAINLKDSLLNISNETKASLMGSMEKLKKLFSGEMLEDSYKKKDRIQFKSRAKNIIATNNDILPNDKSGGFSRRLLVVKFRNHFSDTPNSNQKQKDINLIEDLVKELSGIFNWCHEGYKRLLKQGKFTQTKEHLNAIDELKDDASTVRKYIKDEGAKFFFAGLDEHTKTKPFNFNERYRAYKGFCVENGLIPVGSRQYGKDIRRVMDELGILYDMKRMNYGTGYINIVFPSHWNEAEDVFNYIGSNNKETQENSKDNKYLIIDGKEDKDFTEIN